MNNEFFRKVLKRREPRLYDLVYNVKYSCLVPKAVTIHPIERNLFVTPILTLNDINGYGVLNGSDDYGFESDITDIVNDMFEPYEETLSKKSYGLNHKTSVMITVLEMAEYYDEGNFVYINKEKDLKIVYGLLESIVDYKLKHHRGPNTGNIDMDNDLVILDKLATSMVNVYADSDSEIYFNNNTRVKGRRHLTHKPSFDTNEIKVVLRKNGNKVTPKISMDRLKELGLD